MTIDKSSGALAQRAATITSLRDFLEFLADHGQCLTWPEKVSLEEDIRNIAVAAGRDVQGGPAIIFDKLEGYEGKKIAIGVHGSFGNLALLLGKSKTTTVRELFFDLIGRWGREHAQINRIPADKAAVHNNRVERAGQGIDVLLGRRRRFHDHGRRHLCFSSILDAA